MALDSQMGPKISTVDGCPPFPEIIQAKVLTFEIRQLEILVGS